MTAGACAPRYPAADYALAEPAGPYRLASGDRLRVIVFGQDNLSNIYAVDGAGRIAMPLINPPPPMGTSILSTLSSSLSTSRATVPCPSITSISSKG